LLQRYYNASVPTVIVNFCTHDYAAVLPKLPALMLSSNGNTDTATVKLVYSTNDPYAATPVDDRYTWSGSSFTVNADKGVMANDIKANCTNGGTHTTSLASSSSKGNVAL
jgi:hypothetical protein